MAKNAFEVMALDEDFEIVALLRFSNLQWNRMYYQAGTFSIQLPASQYDSSYKYIYTSKRPEMGEISQVNYSISDGTKMVQLSGYFLEQELNRRVCYQKSTVSNITNEPSWVEASGKAEDVALAFFNGFKDVEYTVDSTAYTSTLGITSPASESRGNDSTHTRENVYLGDKLYDILKPSEMSYRVAFDYQEKTKTLQILKGNDLTQDNADGNNPVIFSTKYGNLKNPNIVISSTDHKNCYISKGSYTEDNVEKVYVEAANENTEDDADMFVYVGASANRNDYDTEAEYISAIQQAGHAELLERPTTISFNFDPLIGSYDYMSDFDLGDKCSLEVEELGLSFDAVLISCNEVIKNGTWTVNMDFDI